MLTLVTSRHKPKIVEIKWQFRFSTRVFNKYKPSVSVGYCQLSVAVVVLLPLKRNVAIARLTRCHTIYFHNCCDILFILFMHMDYVKPMDGEP